MGVWDNEVKEKHWLKAGGTKVVLGVDGGGSTTVCTVMGIEPDPVNTSIAVGGCGAVLAEGLGSSSNSNSVGAEAAYQGLEEAIAAALHSAQVPRKAVQTVCLGMSGVDRPADVDLVRKWIRSIFPDEFLAVSIHNDAVAALASGTGGRLYGCVLIAGTGTIAYGVAKDGTVARAAGAGPALGDRGSGHAIASDALAAVMRASDGRGPPTALTGVILARLKLSKPEDLIGWAYAETSWARIAELVPEVIMCASHGDAVACKIIQEAARELAQSVLAVVKRLQLGGPDCSEPFPVVLAGGVLSNGPIVADPVKEELAAALPAAQCTEAKVQPAVGAAMLAWSDFHTLQENLYKVE